MNTLSRFFAIIPCLILLTVQSYGTSFKVFTLDTENLPSEKAVAALNEDGKFSMQSYGFDLLLDEDVILFDENGNALPTKFSYELNVAPNEGRIAEAVAPNITIRKNVKPSGEFFILSWTIDIRPGITADAIAISLNIPYNMIDHYRPLPQTGTDLLPQKAIFLSTTLGGMNFDASNSSLPWKLIDARQHDITKGFLLQTKLDKSQFQNGLHLRQELKIVRWPNDSLNVGDNRLFYSIPLAGNRPLKDDLPNDKSGGWFDQGVKDLRNFISPYSKECQAIPFRPTDSAIILRGTPHPWMDETSQNMTFPENFTAERLDFLHATGWPSSIGAVVLNYEITYTDGEVVLIPIHYADDIQDWCNIQNEPANARLGWSGHNNLSNVALFHSVWKNPRRNVPLKSIRAISANSDSIPAVVGITATCGSITPSQTEILDKIFNTRGKNTRQAENWYPCTLPWHDTIEEGSALDVSNLLGCEPAGNLGFLMQTNDGTYRFEKAPMTPVRFWGNNTGGMGCAPSKDLADSIASLLAKQGINLMRLHMFCGSGWFEEGEMLLPGAELNPEFLDKFEYFIAALKKHGIYIYMDWNDGVDVAELLKPDYHRTVDHDPAFFRGFKTAMMFNEELLQACEKWGKALFTHVNPYTGLAMVDDPAIAFYEITNENSMLANWTNLEQDVPEPWLTELKGIWENWQIERGIENQQPLPVNFANTEFGLEMQLKYQERMKSFLRSIGVKAPIGTNNYIFCQAELVTYNEMDYANSHIYAAHPIFGEHISYTNGCCIADDIKFLPIANIFPKFKIHGKPSMVNEWNFCYPSDFRCEGLPYMTAYSMLQGCDAMLIFGGNGSFDGGVWERFKDRPGILVLSQLTDPSTWGLMQACAVAYRRGDIKPAQNHITFEYTPEELIQSKAKYNKMQFLGAMSKVDNAIVDEHTERNLQWPNNLPDDASPEGVFFQAADILGIDGCSLNSIASDTGEIKRYTSPALFVVDTPCSKMVVGDLRSAENKERQLQDVKISGNSPFATITITSLDNEPISTSSRILLCAVGNSRNGNSDIDPPVIQSMGDKDVMTEPIFATVKFTALQDRPLTAFALDPLTGKRRNEIPLLQQNDKEIITVDDSTQTIYIELIR